MNNSKKKKEKKFNGVHLENILFKSTKMSVCIQAIDGPIIIHFIILGNNKKAEKWYFPCLMGKITKKRTFVTLSTKEKRYLWRCLFRCWKTYQHKASMFFRLKFTCRKSFILPLHALFFFRFLKTELVGSVSYWPGWVSNEPILPILPIVWRQ